MLCLPGVRRCLQGPLRPRACVVVGGYGGARVRAGGRAGRGGAACRGALRAHAGRRRHRVGGGPRRLRALRRGALRGSVPHRGAGGERRDGFRVSGRGPLRGLPLVRYGVSRRRSPPSGRARRTLPVRRVRGRGGRRFRAGLRRRLPAGRSGLRRPRCRGVPGQRAGGGAARARLGQRFSARCERAGWSPCSAGDEVRCGWFHARGAGVYRRGGMARCRKGGRSCVRGRPRPCRCGRRSGLGF